MPPTLITQAGSVHPLGWCYASPHTLDDCLGFVLIHGKTPEDADISPSALHFPVVSYIENINDNK